MKLSFTNILVFLCVTLVFATGCTTNDQGELAAEIRIENRSSVDVEIQSLRFTYKSSQGAIDTLTYNLNFLESGAVTEYYPLEHNIKKVIMEWPRRGKKYQTYTVFGEIDSVLKGKYTLTLEDKLNLYAEPATQDLDQESDSVMLRIKNGTDYDIEGMLMVLDQERPENPNDLTSRLSVKRELFLFEEPLASSSATGYISTDFAFDLPRGIYFTLKNESFVIYWNHDIDSYFYADSELLDLGYYTYEIRTGQPHAVFSDLIKER